MKYIFSSFENNTAITYTLSVPFLIAITILIGVFTFWKNMDLLKGIFLTGVGPALSMAYRQRKLEHWTFGRNMRLLVLGSHLFLVLIIFIGFGLFSGPNIGLITALSIATYLSISNLVIFLLVDSLRVPTSKLFMEVVEIERKRSIFLMYGFLGLPLFVMFVVFVGT